MSLTFQYMITSQNLKTKLKGKDPKQKHKIEKLILVYLFVKKVYNAKMIIILKHQHQKLICLKNLLML